MTLNFDFTLQGDAEFAQGDAEFAQGDAVFKSFMDEIWNSTKLLLFLFINSSKMN